MTHLVKVATLSALPPGTGRQVQVEDRTVAIFNVGGTLHAIGGSALTPAEVYGVFVAASDAIVVELPDDDDRPTSGR